jgi:hypothetical protein
MTAPADENPAGGDEQDDLAAEWEAMVAGDGANAAAAKPGRETPRVLNQD